MTGPFAIFEDSQCSKKYSRAPSPRDSEVSTLPREVHKVRRKDHNATAQTSTLSQRIAVSTSSPYDLQGKVSLLPLHIPAGSAGSQ